MSEKVNIKKAVDAIENLRLKKIPRAFSLHLF